MEMALNMNANAFAPLTFDELMEIDGGSKETAACILIIGGAVVAGILAPVTCGGSVAAYATVAIAGYSAMGSGVALLI